MIEKYIKDLLYRHDCVIVPNFGGFVTNNVGAKVNHFAHIFYPPTKQIGFNSNLKHNDGLLANYIASIKNISFEEASKIISLTVTKWQEEIQSKSIKIYHVGELFINEDKKIIFSPVTDVNYLTSSFGLTKVNSSPIKRNKESIIPIEVVEEKENKKRIPVFIKYVATVAILLAIGTLGYKGYEHQKEQKQAFSKQQKEVEKKIQEATFIISKPLPTIQLNVTKKSSKAYHIVVGAFRLPKNAAKKVRQLKLQGYNAKIWGVNKWGLTQVAVNSFSEASEAYKTLEKVKKELSKEAWMFIEN